MATISLSLLYLYSEKIITKKGTLGDLFKDYDIWRWRESLKETLIFFFFVYDFFKEIV